MEQSLLPGAVEAAIGILENAARRRTGEGFRISACQIGDSEGARSRL